ncbi:MAG TPA: hypothetical protein VH436_22675 [Vicinamibacterales bacterium]|jgi:hypothetical protein
MARIGTTAITWSDVRAAVGLGLVDAKSPDDPAALSQVIDRRLMMTEVARFPPAEPTPAAIEQRVETMRTFAGAALPELMKSTGLDESRLQDVARDTLRIQGYIMQRFGGTAIVGEDDARRYYDDHREQFTRNGMLLPFEDVEAEARRLASNARLQESIAQWVRDLHMRSEVVVVPDRTQKPK